MYTAELHPALSTAVTHYEPSNQCCEGFETFKNDTEVAKKWAVAMGDRYKQTISVR